MGPRAGWSRPRPVPGRATSERPVRSTGSTCPECRGSATGRPGGGSVQIGRCRLLGVHWRSRCSCADHAPLLRTPRRWWRHAGSFPRILSTASAQALTWAFRSPVATCPQVVPSAAERCPELSPGRFSLSTGCPHVHPQLELPALCGRSSFARGLSCLRSALGTVAGARADRIAWCARDAGCWPEEVTGPGDGSRRAGGRPVLR